METNLNTTPLYSPQEAAQLTAHLTALLDPEYILLFGRLAGGTPFSEAAAYDLLVVVRETPDCDSQQAACRLNHLMPRSLRQIKYLNLHIVTVGYIESNNSPFLHLTHKEGTLLYCNAHHYFRAKKTCNFTQAYHASKLYIDTFFRLGEEYLDHAAGEGVSLRFAAFCAAQAAVCFYHTLHFVYYNTTCESLDPVILHERLRTLSAELMQTLDDDHLRANTTLPDLRNYLRQANTNPRFEADPAELRTLTARVEKIGRIIRTLSLERIELYKQRAAQ